MMDLRPIGFSSALSGLYVELFAECFPHTSKFNPAYIEWLYARNPAGPAIGFDAWDGERLAAHYACIPLRARLEGAEVRALLSLNTATHPAHQGKGLFTQLADRTYTAAAGQGLDAVVGVANNNSTPGFVRKLGFQLVEPLAAKVGMGSLGVDALRANDEAQFRVDWTGNALDWRCSNPNSPVHRRKRRDRLQLFARAFGAFCPAYAELALEDAGAAPAGSASFLSPSRLYIGLEPAATPVRGAYVDVPSRLRPSPLNFIYRPLRASNQRLQPGEVRFTFIDFDAY